MTTAEREAAEYRAKNARTSTPAPKQAASLAECRDCGSEVSRRAKACPRCGAPVEHPARAVATGQRNLIGVFLVGNLLPLVPLVLAFGTGQGFWLGLAFVFYLVAGIALFVMTITLAFKVLQPPAAIALSCLMAVPFVNLIAMVMVNIAATEFLQEHGAKVGFWGADLSSLG